MYTEYIFENKKYEVALRDIKAILFEVVSSEEAKIADLREKAFVSTQDLSQEELQNLYVRQDGCLRRILAISENLNEALKDVDSCSRVLKQIEDKNVDKIVPIVYDEENVNRGKPKRINQEKVGDDFQIPPVVSPKEEVSDAKDSVDEIIQDEGDAQAREEELKNSVANEDALNTAVMEEPVMEYDDSLSTVTPISSGDDTKEAESVSPDVEDSVMEYDDSLSTVVPIDDSEENANVEESSKEPVLVAVTSPPESTSSVIPVIVGNQSSDVGVAPIKEASPDMADSPVLIPGISGSVPAVSTEVSDNSFLFKKRSTDPAKMIMVSAKQAFNLRQSISTQEGLLNAKGFFPAAIGTVVSQDNLEQQLVNNGLLPANSSVTSAQIEQLMNKANQLYASGQVEEAQSMYNQISALNKKLQGESVGIVK